MIIGLFAKWPVLGRETIPVKSEQMNGVIPGTAVSADILTGKPIGSLPEKTVYLWEGQYIYASGEISHGELGFLRDAYNEMTAALRRLVWIIGCFFLFLGMRIVSAWALRRINSLAEAMHLGMMIAFCGGVAAELQKCRAAAGCCKGCENGSCGGHCAGGENCSECTCNAGNGNGTGDENGACHDAADEGYSCNGTDDESSSGGNADNGDSTRKSTAAGENNHSAK